MFSNSEELKNGGGVLIFLEIDWFFGFGFFCWWEILVLFDLILARNFAILVVSFLYNFFCFRVRPGGSGCFFVVFLMKVRFLMWLIFGLKIGFLFSFWGWLVLLVSTVDEFEISSLFSFWDWVRFCGRILIEFDKILDKSVGLFVLGWILPKVRFLGILLKRQLVQSLGLRGWASVWSWRLVLLLPCLICVFS